MIQYVYTSEGVTPNQLGGFFVGWPNPPSAETHLRLLAQSDEIVLAIDDEAAIVVGFITALTDRVLCAYIPLLEVLPAYQGRGVGTALVQKMLARLNNLYMVDLLCDGALQPFYASSGMAPATGMMLRNYGRQSGAAAVRHSPG